MCICGNKKETREREITNAAAAAAAAAVTDPLCPRTE